MKMPSNDKFLAGSVAARYVEAFGTTDPGHTDQGSYIADGGLFDADHTFSNVTAAFLQYTDSPPAGVYQSADLTANLTSGNRYSIQRTSLINVQSQMLLWFRLV